MPLDEFRIKLKTSSNGIKSKLFQSTFSTLYVRACRITALVQPAGLNVVLFIPDIYRGLYRRGSFEGRCFMLNQYLPMVRPVIFGINFNSVCATSPNKYQDFVYTRKRNNLNNRRSGLQVRDDFSRSYCHLGFPSATAMNTSGANRSVNTGAP